MHCLHKKVPGPLKAGDREWSTQKTGPIIMNGMPQALSAIKSNTPLLQSMRCSVTPVGCQMGCFNSSRELRNTLEYSSILYAQMHARIVNSFSKVILVACGTLLACCSVNLGISDVNCYKLYAHAQLL